MEEMKIMLTMLGLIVVGVIAWIIFTSIRNNLAKNSKNISQKAEIIMKKDMSSKYARCTFYMNNDYDNGYSQKEWMDLYKERVSSKEWDKKSAEYAEAVAPFVNALVVDDRGYFVRRGTESLLNQLEKFIPGNSDNITVGYFIEPYKYYRNKATKQTQAEQDYKATSAESGSASLSRMQAQRELFFAQKRYRDATSARVKHKGTLHEGIYEAREKEAYAKMLSAQIKYDNSK